MIFMTSNLGASAAFDARSVDRFDEGQRLIELTLRSFRRQKAGRNEMARELLLVELEKK